MKKIALVLFASAASLSAFASFEMALVCDYSNNKIDRYDPVSGTYLGSFGTGYVFSPYDITINQSTSTAYVVDYNSRRIKAFNYNTGEYLGPIGPVLSFNPYFIDRLSNGNLLASSYGNVNTFVLDSTTGATLQTFNSSTLYMEGSTQTADGNLWFVDGIANKVQRGILGNSTLQNNYSLVGASNTPSYICASGNNLACVSYNPTSGAKRLTYLNTSGGNVVNETSILLSNGNINLSGSVAFGHNNTLYAASNVTTGNLMYRWTPGDFFTSSFSLSATGGAGGMAMVVAPEPGGLLVLGVAAWFLRRRK